MHIRPRVRAATIRMAQSRSFFFAFIAALFLVLATVAVVGRGARHFPVWPVSGVLTALSLSMEQTPRRRRYVFYLAGGFGTLAGAVVVGLPWLVAATIAILTTMNLFIAGGLLCAHVHAFDDLRKHRNSLRLVLASLAVPLLTALPDLTQVSASSKIPAFAVAATFILADAVGLVIFVPTTLLFLTGFRQRSRRLLVKPTRLILSSALFLMVCSWTFWQDTSPYLFLIFPPTILLLLSSGLEGAVLCSLIIDLIGWFATSHGRGPVYLGNPSPAMRLMTLQLLDWVVIVTALPVGAALDERRKAECVAVHSMSMQRELLKQTREAQQGWIRERRVLSKEQMRLTEAEQAAQYQLQLRDEFLSHVSHELRSPLTSIYSFSSIVADGLAGATTREQDEYLNIVLKNVAQLQSMIEDLLTVTQSHEGKLHIELQSTSMSEAVADALKTLESFAKRKQISMSSEIMPGCGLVYADPVRLRQVLIILLDNAIKFTPEGGSVRVLVRVQADMLLTQVIDSGRGIAQDQWSLIFDKLYQVENTRSSSAGRTGLGLGLHIAKNLIAQQCGNIWVTSVLGEGSTFRFTLPRYHGQDSSPCVDAEDAVLEAEAEPAALPA